MAKVTFRSDWQNSGAVNRLITKLNEGTEVNDSGSITFVAHDYRDLFFLLAECIVFPTEITRNDISAISYRSFLDIRKKGFVNEKELIGDIAIRVATLQSTKLRKFTMWTKMRLRQMPHHSGTRFQLDGVTIRTVAYLPRWLQLDEHFISGVGRINPNTLPFYGYIILTVDARNENDASKRIYGALDIFAAVVNTYTRSTELWSQRRPSAKIWPGPYQFFFEGRKFLGEDKVWYSPNFDEKEWELFPSSAKEFVKVARSVRKILKNLDGHPLRLPLERSLVLVSEGMVSKDLSFRLMRFWSAAEALYSLDKDRTSIQKIIDRMLFNQGKDKPIERIKLERAYQLRNSYVHQGSSDGDDSSLTQNLRELILHHVYYLTFNGRDIESHSDLLMMFDLPSDPSALSRRIKAIDRRMKIIETGKHFDG